MVQWWFNIRDFIRDQISLPFVLFKLCPTPFVQVLPASFLREFIVVRPHVPILRFLRRCDKDIVLAFAAKVLYALSLSIFCADCFGWLRI